MPAQLARRLRGNALALAAVCSVIRAAAALVVAPGVPTLSPRAVVQLDALYPQTEETQRVAASRKDGYWPYISKKVSPAGPSTALCASGITGAMRMCPALLLGVLAQSHTRRERRLSQTTHTQEEPPQELTYGEFPLPLFGELVDRAACYAAACQGGRRADAEFLDLGSGAGRLVLAAAAMSNPWKRCRGVEYLHSLHLLAEEKLDEAGDLSAFLQSDVMFEECSWESPGLDLSNVDVAFA